MSKNIFKKLTNNNNINNNINNLEDSIDSCDLSDELNKLMGNNSINSTKKSYSIIYTTKTDINNINKINNNEEEKFFNISNIFNDISCLLNKNFSNIKIIGEIIKFKISDSNAWIDVKTDDGFQILCVSWKITLDKNYNSKYKNIKSGDKIIFEGKFGIMKKNLSIYFNVKSMNEFGKGNYLDIYEQYRLKIKDMRLRVNKKQLNVFPYTIGIITSLEGAAIQDILQTLRLDNFIGNIIIKNSIVQGFQCPKSLINSIEWFESNYDVKQIDLLMVTRGGGGWDDLVGFSDWDLVLKLSETNFLTLSAVGHQIDNQLTDEVSDYKFATPSIGAKFIVESQQKYIKYLNDYKNSIENILESYSKLKNIFKLSVINNYSNIIKKYDTKEYINKIKKYSSKINQILNNYNNLKNLFFSKLSNLKPTIMRKNELTSINDFVNTNTNEEIKPKKIEIYFIDGMVGLSYKIVKYEKIN